MVGQKGKKMSQVLRILFILPLLTMVNPLQQQQPHASFIGNSPLRIRSLIKVQNDELAPSMLIPIKTANISSVNFKNINLVPESQLFNVYFDSVRQQLDKQSQEFDIGNHQTVGTTVAPKDPSTSANNIIPYDNITSHQDDGRPTQTNITTISTSTTSKPAPLVSTSQDVGSNETGTISTTTVTPTTMEPEPPVGSMIIRQGDAVYCGEANKKGNSTERLVPFRIVGGSKSDPGEFPFQVRLNINSKRGSGICGGVILDDTHILTAAHCMTACVSRHLTTATIETTGVQATIGDHAIKFEDGEANVEIEKIVPHEKYDACNFYANDHDIAVLKTKDKIQYKFTSDGYGSINRPCAPSKDQVYREGEPVIVSGWGVTRENSGSLSNILRYVQIPVVGYSRCRETYGSRVTNDHVCAGYNSGGKDSCQGDSGGPLVRVMDNKYELVGIVSFGYGCGQPGAPGVYTKVSSYLDWIEANL